MTVKELLEMMKDADPEMTVVFTGNGEDFFSPCPNESGIIEFDVTCDADGSNQQEGELQKYFALIPHEINWEEVAP